MNGWISVKDKLPSTDDHVLVYTVSGFMRVAHLYKSNRLISNGVTEHYSDPLGVMPHRWICDRLELEDKVVYWKPLAEIPEMGMR